jgi:hypothetical protein
MAREVGTSCTGNLPRQTVAVAFAARCRLLSLARGDSRWPASCSRAVLACAVRAQPRPSHALATAPSVGSRCLPASRKALRQRGAAAIEGDDKMPRSKKTTQRSSPQQGISEMGGAMPASPGRGRRPAAKTETERSRRSATTRSAARRSSASTARAGSTSRSARPSRVTSSAAPKRGSARKTAAAGRKGGSRRGSRAK